MLRLTYVLRGRPRGRDGLDRIRATYYLDDRRHFFDTPLACYPGDWDGERRRVKASAKKTPHHLVINERLSEAEQKASKFDNRALSEGRAIPAAEAEEVCAILAGAAGTRVASGTSLLGYMEEFMESRKSSNTRRNYAVTLRELRANDAALDWYGLTRKWYDGYVKRLKAAGAKRDSAWGKYVSHVKTVAKAAHADGLHANDAYQLFKAPKETPAESARTRVWLEPEQLALIWAADLPDDSPLSYARDYFAVGVESGQRVSDWRQVLDAKDAVTKGGTAILEVVQRKGDKRCTVVLTDRLARVRERRRAGLVPDVHEKTLREHLRTLGLTVGVGSLSSTHIARRTFGRLRFTVDKMDLDTIAVLLGHSKASETAHYIGLDGVPVRHGVADRAAAQMSKR